MHPSVRRVRAAAVAGRFYPRDAARLADDVDKLIDAVELPADEPLAAAYVVPHAGYRFSGPTAAQVYARLRRHAGQVRRVVLAGPAHFVPLAGCAVPVATAWACPLGEVPVVDWPARPELSQHVSADDAPHAREHALEVQLPFLHRAMGRAVPVLPIAVGTGPAGPVAACIAAAAAPGTAAAAAPGTATAAAVEPSDSTAADLAAAAADPGTVVLCSTDLSHYLDKAAADARDARTAEAVLALAPDRIDVRDACGVFALRGLLTWAAAQELRPALLQLCTSADTAGDPSRVVGYGAFAFYPPERAVAPRAG